jgi:hypothetical protein
MLEKPSSVTYEEYIKAQKVVFDYLKHLTTLNTGSIVLLTVFLERFAMRLEWGFLLDIALASFTVSIFTFTLSAFGVIRSIRETPEKIGVKLANFTSYNFILGLLGFSLGVGTLTVFAIKNLL